MAIPPFRTPHLFILIVLALTSAGIFYTHHFPTPSPVSDTIEAALHRPLPPHPRRRGEHLLTAGTIKMRRALHASAITLGAGIALVRIDRHCGRRASFLTTLLGIARGAEGTGAALEWSEAPRSPAPWTGRRHHAAILVNGTVLSHGGAGGSTEGGVFHIEPGGTTLKNVSSFSGRFGHCVVHLPGTNEIVIIAGRHFNDAWRSSDSGLTFTQISWQVFSNSGGRSYHGCVAVSATKLFAFGGRKYDAPVVYYNDVRVSTDSGATWSDVDHSSCGANHLIWSKRIQFGYTFMPLLGRIVIASGQEKETDTLYHNDVWYSNGDAKCWTLAKNDTNLAADGYSGATLLTVPFGGVEALLLLGGRRKDGGYRNTVQLSIDGGAIWSIVASVGVNMWSGREQFTAIVDTHFARLLVWGGYGGSYRADLWTTSILPIYEALVPSCAPFSVIGAYCGMRTPCLIEGNDQLTIIGTNFSDAANLSIAVGGEPCTDVTVTAAYTALCTTPCFASFSTHLLISITSSSAPNGIFNWLSSSGNSAASVATTDAYTSTTTNFVCTSSPKVTGIECITPDHCNVDVSGSLRVPANEPIRLRGMNFGPELPKLNIALQTTSITFGSFECFQTVSNWSSTAITLTMCAASGTDLPIKITLGTKTSPTSATVVSIKEAATCAPGLYSKDFVCAPCQIGRHGRTTPSEITTCDPCKLGSYAADEKSSTCAECPLDTVTGIVTGRTNCTFCKSGEVRDLNRVYCSKCDAGKYKTLALDNSKYHCAGCPPLTYAVAGSMNCSACPKTGEFPDSTRGICLSCAVGSYRGRDARGDACTRCPLRGVRCEDSSLQILDNHWLAPIVNRTIEFTTPLYECANDEACIKPALGTLTVECAATKGYGGVLCGECDRDNLHEHGYFTRVGHSCAECWADWENWLAFLAIGLALLVGSGYLVAEHSFAVEPGEYRMTVQKIAFSHLQMLGVLGIFKAKGTAIFNEIASRPAEVVGGSVTSMLPIKCALQSQIYGPFLLTMLLPPVLLGLAGLLLIPTTLVERAMREKRAGRDAPTFTTPLHLPRCIVCCKALRKPMTAAETEEWYSPFAPMQRLAGVAVFVIFSLYPSLVASIASMFNCTAPIDAVQYLVADLTVRCYEGWHIAFVIFATFGAIVYAIGIPFAVAWAVTAHFPLRSTANRKLAFICSRRKATEYRSVKMRSQFAFLYNGFVTDRSGVVVAWEALVMMRKLAVTLAGTMVSDPYLQILAAQLILVVSFGVTAYVQPYETAWLNLLDIIGLFVLIVTQVLSIVYFYTEAATRPFTDAAAVETLVTVLLFVINSTALLIFGGFFASELTGLRQTCYAKRCDVYAVAGEEQTRAALRRAAAGGACPEDERWCHPSGVVVSTPPESNAGGSEVWTWFDAEGVVTASIGDPTLLLLVKSLEQLRPRAAFHWVEKKSGRFSAMQRSPRDVGGWVWRRVQTEELCTEAGVVELVMRHNAHAHRREATVSNAPLGGGAGAAAELEAALQERDAALRETAQLKVEIEALSIQGTAHGGDQSRRVTKRRTASSTFHEAFAAFGEAHEAGIEGGVEGESEDHEALPAADRPEATIPTASSQQPGLRMSARFVAS